MDVSKSRWFTVIGVCTLHWLILSALGNADSITRAKGEVSRRDFGSRASSIFIIQAQSPATLTIGSNPKFDLTTKQAGPFELASPMEKSSAADPTRFARDESATEDVAGFNRERFFDLDELDEPATGTSGFETALNDALPTTFEIIVLEFLINEMGVTVQITCIDGDCSNASIENLQALASIPFLPAMKNGSTVASRKVIQVLPLPRFGL